jgi:hypothetical protein
VCFISGRGEASLGREECVCVCVCVCAQEKRLYTGESYRVVEAQSENKTKQRRWVQTCLPNSYKEQPRVEVLKTLYVIVPVTFRSLIIICSYDWWVSNKSIHLIQNPLIISHVTRIRDSMFRKIMTPPSSWLKWRWSRIFFRNVGIRLQDCTVSKPIILLNTEEYFKATSIASTWCHVSNLDNGPIF